MLNLQEYLKFLKDFGLLAESKKAGAAFMSYRSTTTASKNESRKITYVAAQIIFKSVTKSNTFFP